jgi:hypothetical protein
MSLALRLVLGPMTAYSCRSGEPTSPQYALPDVMPARWERYVSANVSV